MLHRIVRKSFEQTPVRFLKRKFFDETKGQSLLAQTRLQDQKVQKPECIYVSLASFSALITYLEMQYSQLLCLRSLEIELHEMDEILVMDSQTMRDLELLGKKDQFSTGTALADRFACQTSGGIRLLRQNLMQPLSNPEKIRQRQQAVQLLLSSSGIHEKLTELVREFKDSEQITEKFVKKPRLETPANLKSYIHHLS